MDRYIWISAFSPLRWGRAMRPFRMATLGVVAAQTAVIAFMMVLFGGGGGAVVVVVVADDSGKMVVGVRLWLGVGRV